MVSYAHAVYVICYFCNMLFNVYLCIKGDLDGDLVRSGVGHPTQLEKGDKGVRQKWSRVS